jgi:hypothetical protein
LELIDDVVNVAVAETDVEVHVDVSDIDDVIIMRWMVLMMPLR